MFAYLKVLRLILRAGEVSLSEFHIRFIFLLAGDLQIKNPKCTSITSTQHLTPPHHVIICGTHVFPSTTSVLGFVPPRLDSEGPYKVSIGGMRLRLQELQEENTQAQMMSNI